MAPSLLFAVLCTCFAVVVQAAPLLDGDNFQLKQVHVVTRHGARFPLTKHADSLKEGTSGVLTPTGIRQMYDLGVFLQSRYGSFLPTTYTSDKVRIHSSSLDRTILSANALTLGLFPTSDNNDPSNHVLPGGLTVNVPVYTTESQNDVTIRAYDKCDRFLQELSVIYQTSQWKQLQAQKSDLLYKLGQINSFAKYADPTTGRIPLKELWNVYDSIFVAKTECASGDSGGGGGACSSLEDASVKDALSDADWRELQALVKDVEAMKYASPAAGGFVGGNLVRQILFSMEGFLSGFLEHKSPSFFVYSAHYPTLMGIFGALGDNPSFARGEVIPSYASAIIFELYEHTTGEEQPFGGSRAVKLYYRPGESLDGTVSNDLVGFDKVCQFDELCPLADIVEPFRNWDERRWCEMCDNHSADVCLLLNYYENGGAQGCSTGRPALVGLVSGLVIGALGMVVFGCWNRKRKAAKSSNVGATVSTEGIPEPPSVQIT